MDKMEGEKDREFTISYLHRRLCTAKANLMFLFLEICFKTGTHKKISQNLFH